MSKRVNTRNLKDLRIKWNNKRYLRFYHRALTGRLIIKDCINK